VKKLRKKMPETILVLDFGSQYAQLITRRVREAQVYAELLPWDIQENEALDRSPRGIILSGGPSSVYEPGAPQLPDWVLKAGLPVLGICYGLQVLAVALGGRVSGSTMREFGPAELQIVEQSTLFKSGDPRQVWMSHGDRIETLPPGFTVLASTANSPVAAMGDRTRRLYGLQFHPEVAHSHGGRAIIRRFVRQVCGCSGDWTPSSIIDDAVTHIREQVGDARVISAVSGGVDSSVATALVGKALGGRLTAVFVDTGLMRSDEVKWVEKAFRSRFGVHLITLDAAKTFFENLKGVISPERKREIIGETFIRQFESVAQDLDAPQFLVQGTIYPDVIESRAPERSHAHRIKTHHNVGGLPEVMSFDLIEPLRYLFKDEVRQVGETLGLPEELVWRQPFPGPGLAVRCLGEVTPERVAKLRQADQIFLQELYAAGLLRISRGMAGEPTGTAQAFAVLLPVKAVGVMGDQRTYEEVIALRAVTTEDFMTADWARLPYDLLGRAANRIVNEVAGVNRVVFDITSKPPGTIEWE
jgi:GMP synthase (glutamine-hydrolysing)